MSTYVCPHEPAHMVHIHAAGEGFHDDPAEDEDRYDCDPECAVPGAIYPTIEENTDAR